MILIECLNNRGLATIFLRPSGTEDIYKLYAESFKGKEHLDTIVCEAQAIVTAALS